MESYEHTVDVPFSWLELKTRAKLPNLHQFKLILVPLLTRADVHIFGGIAEYGHKTWAELKLLHGPRWNNSKAGLMSEQAAAAAARAEIRRLWDAVARHAAGLANMKKDEMETFIGRVRESG